MVLRTSQIVLPFSNAKMKTSHKTLQGNGVGAVLLDGGLGGQSSYHGIDDYYETTNMNPSTKGKGLADRISNKLSKLNISSAPVKKLKNISLSI